MNSEKIILDLCGGTGSWSKPYADAGYDVRVITWPLFDVQKVDIDETTDTIIFHGKMKDMRVDMTRVHGIFAAPPCTQFSLARAGAKTPRDFDGAMATVQACLQIIWSVRKAQNNNLKWWALENPRGYLRQFLGKPAFHFQAWEFGDPLKKPTDIWGYFKEPTKKPIQKPDYPRKGKGSWANTQGRGGSARRSITPPGWAAAFFKANQ